MIPSRGRKLSSAVCGVLLVIAASSACNSRQSPPSGKAAATEATASEQAEVLWLTGHALKLKTEIMRSPRLTDQPALVVVLHGDSPFSPPSYQYLFAREAASEIDNAIFAAILRPGYSDDTGQHSGGEGGMTTGDNYTPEDIDAIAQVVEQLKTRLHPAVTLLVGHSGGAAISADTLGRWPQLVNGALLVSCPCDLKKFRWHMMKKQENPIWLLPVKSLSPIDLAGSVSRNVVVRMLVGSADDVAPPELSQEYADALRSPGVNVTLTVAPGLPHDILLEPPAFTQLKLLINDVAKPPAGSPGE